MKINMGLLVWAMTFLSCDGRPAFVSRVPNGSGVTGVAALGHVNTGGGGSLNAFGQAFANAGRAWTTALCQQDSDEDGATNGEELGDPCCTWSASAGFDTPSATKTPTHPGVANSFTTTQLTTMTCGGEADLDLTASSGVDSSASSSAVADTTGSSTSSFTVGDGSNSDSSSSLNSQLNPENRPSFSPVPRTTELPSVANTGSLQSCRIASWVMALTTLLVLCL